MIVCLNAAPSLVCVLSTMVPVLTCVVIRGVVVTQLIRQRPQAQAGADDVPLMVDGGSSPVNTRWNNELRLHLTQFSPDEGNFYLLASGTPTVTSQCTQEFV